MQVSKNAVQLSCNLISIIFLRPEVPRIIRTSYMSSVVPFTNKTRKIVTNKGFQDFKMIHFLVICADEKIKCQKKHTLTTATTPTTTTTPIRIGKGDPIRIGKGEEGQKKKRSLLFYIYFGSGRYEQKEHYVIYDFNREALREANQIIAK